VPEFCLLLCLFDPTSRLDYAPRHSSKEQPSSDGVRLAGSSGRAPGVPGGRHAIAARRRQRRGERLRLNKQVLAGVVTLLIAVTSISVYAQVRRPFRPGTVWTMAFIRMKPGMETAYLNYIAGTWKTNQEAAKKEGLILSYKVLTTEGHSPADFNIILMTEYKDLATMEANEPKADALAQKVEGDDTKQMQGYKDRAEIREIVGDRLAREMVLEPRP
jgi:hypothetical protein